MHKLFLQLTGLGRVARLKKIRQAPFNLQRSLIALIDEEAENARRLTVVIEATVSADRLDALVDVMLVLLVAVGKVTRLRDV